MDNIIEHDVKTISRIINGENQRITLTQTEADAIYRSVETECVKEDILSRCTDRKQKDMLPAPLVPLTLENEIDLLEYAYNFYHKIHDCNIDYNSTLDAVIDQTAEWIQQQNSSIQNRLFRIMANPQMCSRFAEHLFDQINTDDESLEKIGFYLCKAYTEGDLNQLLVSICGWSMDSLLDAVFEKNL